MTKKKRKFLLVFSSAILIPTTILGVTFLILSMHKNKINDEELNQDEINDLGNFELDFYTSNQNEFIKKLKNELNKNFGHLNMDFDIFEYDNIQYDFKTGDGTFHIYEKYAYQKEYSFKFHVQRLNEILFDHQNIGQFLKDNNQFQIDSDIWYKDLKQKELILNLNSQNRINFSINQDKWWSENDSASTKFETRFEFLDIDQNIILDTASIKYGESTLIDTDYEIVHPVINNNLKINLDKNYDYSKGGIVKVDDKYQFINKINTILDLKNGNMLASCNEFVFLIQPIDGKLLILDSFETKMNVLSNLLTQQNTILLGTDKEGLYKLNLSNDKNKILSLEKIPNISTNNSQITSLIQQKDGKIYLSSNFSELMDEENQLSVFCEFVEGNNSFESVKYSYAEKLGNVQTMIEFEDSKFLWKTLEGGFNLSFLDSEGNLKTSQLSKPGEYYKTANIFATKLYKGDYDSNLKNYCYSIKDDNILERIELKPDSSSLTFNRVDRISFEDFNVLSIGEFENKVFVGNADNTISTLTSYQEFVNW